ncbi:conjugal pilus assembly protein TraF (plasmid) [Rickettsiales bacterium Ac37b]|nr:conjugal pilus assembly protein TraF [Rickettsiales bacterium Ac37b]
MIWAFIYFFSFFLFQLEMVHAFKFTPEICEKYGLGKNWYCENNKQVKPDEPTLEDIMSSSSPAEQKAAELKELWDTNLKRATITGSKEDLEGFLKVHNFIVDKGIDFSRNVQRIIDTSPVYANNESYYKNVVESKLREDSYEHLLYGASSRYGLVFIYDVSCPYCARQLPILMDFKSKYNFKILGITTGDGIFKGLDENKIDENIANDSLVEAYPTIILIDRLNPAKIFISKGLITLDKLEEKIARRIEDREVSSD